MSHLRPFSATFVLRMRWNGYLWTSGVNLDTAVRFPDPDFLLQCKISAILATLSVDFCILYAESYECPPYFYFRFVWPTDLQSSLQSIPHASTPKSIIPTKFEDPTPMSATPKTKQSFQRAKISSRCNRATKSVKALKAHTDTHTLLTALFRDYPGEPVPERPKNIGKRKTHNVSNAHQPRTAEAQDNTNIEYGWHGNA